MDGPFIRHCFPACFGTCRIIYSKILIRSRSSAVPGGTQWGANAVNGVINITTKSAKDTQGLYMEAGGGTELRDFSGVRYGGTLASECLFSSLREIFRPQRRGLR
jgi:hypothetical protein